MSQTAQDNEPTTQLQPAESAVQPSNARPTNPLGFKEILTPGGSVIVSDITSVVGVAARNSIVTECVTKEIFPFKKFVLLERELDFGGKLQKRVTYKLNVEHEKEEWWKDNRELIRKRLTKKRNNVQEAIRRKVMSK